MRKDKGEIVSYSRQKQYTCIYRSILEELIDIHAAEVGDMAHLLPVMGDIIGRDEDELRRGVRICDEKRESESLNWFH